MSTIGDRIKNLRKSENLTQKEFAKRLLVSQSYLSGLENNNEIPTNKLIKLICLEFGVSEDWITDDIGKMYSDVYENDKSVLADISNSALIKILNMLTTKSNVEYGHYAYALNSFSSILANTTSLNENDKLRYLECVEMFIANFERAIQISYANTDKARIEHLNFELSRDTMKVLSEVAMLETN